MCQCKDDVKVQEYQNQVVLEYPFDGKDAVSIDGCIAEEIEILWAMGIETTGCCCGHNYAMPYIGVKKEYIESMLSMGYNIQVNPNGLPNIQRMDSFYPKSIEISVDMYKKYLKHLALNIYR